MSAEQDLISLESPDPVDETVAKIEAFAQSKGVTVFYVVDHSGEAEKAGLKMRPTKVVIFGSPKAGTPLMVARPSLAIDLPLRALVAEEEDGKTLVTYTDPQYLKRRHGIPDNLMSNISGIGALLAKAVE